MASEMRFVGMFYKSWTGLIQNLGFWKGLDEFMQQITMETCPPVSGITGTGHPSSYRSFISLTDNEVPAGGSQSRK